MLIQSKLSSIKASTLLNSSIAVNTSSSIDFAHFVNAVSSAKQYHKYPEDKVTWCRHIPNKAKDLEQNLEEPVTVLVQLFKEMEPSCVPRIALEVFQHGLHPRRKQREWIGNFNFNNVKLAQLSYTTPDKIIY